jgi:hydrogenase 3 maturation protease
MLPNSWQASVQNLLNQPTAEPRIAIVGIGNALRSDDAAGTLVAGALLESRLLQDLETVLVMDAGHAPENGTHQLRRFEPQVVLLIDAAEMGETPGTIRLIETAAIDGMSASTHSLPLSMLANYLVLELNCQIAVLGIQPASTDVGEGIDLRVDLAVRQIVKELEQILTGISVSN